MISQGLNPQELRARDERLLREGYPDRSEAEIEEMLTLFEGTYQGIQRNLMLARQHAGPTLFDWIVTTIGYYPNVTLRLEP
jgi:hypothetical protein